MKRTTKASSVIAAISVILATILLFISLCSCCCPLLDTSGSGNNTGGLFHSHSYSSWKTVEEATCTEDGIRERSCSCGDTQTEVIYATGHTDTNGKCKGCGMVMDPYKALIHYLKTSGTKSSDGTSYSVYYKASSDINSYISYNVSRDAIELFTITTSGDLTAISRIIVNNSNNHSVDMLISSSTSSSSIYASGYIYPNTFDVDNPYIYGYAADSTNSSVRSIFNTSLSLTLKHTKNLLISSGTGITIDMLGYTQV